MWIRHHHWGVIDIQTPPSLTTITKSSPIRLIPAISRYISHPELHIWCYVVAHVTLTHYIYATGSCNNETTEPYYQFVSTGEQKSVQLIY